ncbi:MAG: cupin domain-containing protein [Betaproteobacteria bacterium]|nr:cupin domain-containing protein [Betaproteobacteria bacterium]
MPFYRFDDLQRFRLNPHLSTAEGPIIEGSYMYFRRVTKRAGTGSELHYHPNELMTFPLRGKVNCLVGRERRIVYPGTFVHVPPFARHSFKATEDGDLDYLYIKDRTWTMIGSAVDEALPDKAPSAEQVAKDFAEGKWPGRPKEPGRSGAIVEGLGQCYYPMSGFLDAPPASGHYESWVSGVHLAFGFVELPERHETEERQAAHELFAYLIRGALDATVDGKRKRVAPGGVIHVPRGSRYRWSAIEGDCARYAVVRSTLRLEEKIERDGAADNWRG